MQRILTILLFTIFSTTAIGQTYQEKFKKLFKEKDTTSTRSLLQAWEKSYPNDPELYTSAFNFYFFNSRQEVVSIEKEQGKKENFQLTDSAGNTWFLTSNNDYNPVMLKQAFQYINKGIEKFPNRLDMRFGKCYALEQIQDYKNFTTEILKTVQYSTINKNNWLWTADKNQEDGEHFMLGAIQDYLKQLYDTENDSLLPDMIRIGEFTLQSYPDNVEILSTTSVALMLTKNYDKALIYLKHAEKLNPKDYIVLNNIAQGYKLKGDKANAIKYYELVKKYGPENAKLEAEESIRKLK
jgi:tetratricopeptide (TPR) repeat protein